MASCFTRRGSGFAIIQKAAGGSVYRNSSDCAGDPDNKCGSAVYHRGKVTADAQKRWVKVTSETKLEVGKKLKQMPRKGSKNLQQTPIKVPADVKKRWIKTKKLQQTLRKGG